MAQICAAAAAKRARWAGLGHGLGLEVQKLRGGKREPKLVTLCRAGGACSPQEALGASLTRPGGPGMTDA